MSFLSCWHFSFFIFSTISCYDIIHVFSLHGIRSSQSSKMTPKWKLKESHAAGSLCNLLVTHVRIWKCSAVESEIAKSVSSRQSREKSKNFSQNVQFKYSWMGKCLNLILHIKYFPKACEAHTWNMAIFSALFHLSLSLSLWECWIYANIFVRASAHKFKFEQRRGKS